MDELAKENKELRKRLDAADRELDKFRDLLAKAAIGLNDDGVEINSLRRTIDELRAKLAEAEATLKAHAEMSAMANLALIREVQALREVERAARDHLHSDDCLPIETDTGNAIGAALHDLAELRADRR